jgi:hypothetical protein
MRAVGERGQVATFAVVVLAVIVAVILLKLLGAF